jgi:hypothetical protein
MATWHQTRAGFSVSACADMDHWTVVANPPNDCAAITSGFTSQATADAYRDRLLSHHPELRGYVIVLAPKGSK